MDESIYLNPLRPQPYDGGDGTVFDGLHELVDFLPGTSMRFWYTSKPDAFGRHWHDAMELLSCEQGYYLSEIDGVTYQVNPGDILLIPGGVVHTLSPMENCRGYVHIISLQLLNTLQSAVTLLPILSRPRFISKKEQPCLNQAANTFVEQMRNEYFSNNDLRELSVYSYLLQLFTVIGRNYFDSAQATMHLRRYKHKEYADKFNEILTYIANHYNEEITLEQVAHQYGFSKCYFSRMFSQYTSYNFTEYITSQRIQAAKTLLMQRDYSICEIAERAGFSSLSTFNRVFKEKTGCAPSKYQELYIQP